ncbi:MULTISPECIES: rhomboid family intramembrane serine protease [Aequorivita]|uniref:Rhomboid family intramembrane serine protease n=1 Tax=Aequorivita iocasae TaxID=2803865 RepID=A0ABX7DSL1_9FLAO|nr:MULTISPECIES: rhomboid family intramembrane serine protease [Aequorivita]QQX76606.1 rhomboid family intramembrane serine protease [Aequorivita iocasae]UCA56077.1 rhomboid family intramembrane serine protease [Aequorivita sp. F7]
MGRITDTVKFLLILNVIFFIGTQFTGGTAERLFALYYFENPGFQLWQPLTSMFMHANFFHILFNMYALWAFGSPLEIRWGQKKFLFFYFSAGLGSALIYTLVNYFQLHNGMDALISAGMSPEQVMDLLNSGKYNTAILDYVSQDTIQGMYNTYNGVALGASGAVYGVLVAFGMLFPNIELMLIFLPIPIKAKYFIPGIILLDIVFGITGTPTGIAHWAHIGGALFGFIMAWYWKKNSFDNHRWN